MLNVNHLSKRYGSKVGLEPLTFETAPGRILGLVGPNGAGKTTTISCLAGILRPNTGTIQWKGKNLSDQSGVVSLIPESPEVYPLLSVFEHLELTARLFKLGVEWRQEANRWVSEMDLEGHRNTFGSALSKGLRQRLLLACMALRHSQVLLVDEPMIGLDPKGQRDVKELLSRFKKDGSTIVLSSHQLGLVEELADDVIILNHGAMVARGSIDELRQSSDASLEDLFFHYTGAGSRNPS